MYGQEHRFSPATPIFRRFDVWYVFRIHVPFPAEAEQEQLKQEIEALKAEVSEADTEATNVSKLIAVTKKYTRIDLV